MTPSNRKTAPALMLLLSAVLAFAADAPSMAQDNGRPVLRYGNTSPMFTYDSRSDDRDFRNNNMFPGNFAGDPPEASVGIEGFLAGNSQRSVRPYPSQVVLTPPPAAPCPRHHKHACK